jgi:hypothetical protein
MIMSRRSAFITLAFAWLLATGALQGQALSQAQSKKTQPRPATPAKPSTPAPSPAARAPEPPPPPSDVRIVSTYTQGAQVFQNTTCIKGERQRVEFPGMVSIHQCDLQRTVMLNPAAKRYRVQADAAGAQTANQPGPSGGALAAQTALSAGQSPRGGVVTLTMTLTDTLERQTMFGLEARHVKTVMTKQSDANACDKTPLRSEIDGWYIDLPKTASSCARPGAQQEPPPVSGDCRDRVETRVVGDVSLGFPVKTVTTTVTGDGNKQETTTNSVEVTALEVTRLDASLFDIPSDYAAASSSLELMPSVANGASLEEAMFGSTADGTSQAAPKKPGTIRIGVLEPVNKSARTLNTRVLRQDLVGKFSKAPYEALPLSGSSAAAIEADATRLACDYILLGEITEVKATKPGKVGGLLKTATGGGGGPSKDEYDVKASYRMYASGATSTPRAMGDVKASSGAGFSLGSALKMASFAGQMYMGFGMVRAMRGGFGMGLDPMSAIASTGGFGPIGRNYFDPRAMAMSSAMNSMTMGMAAGAFTGAAADPSDGEVYHTVSEAFDNIAKAATAKITPGK